MASIRDIHLENGQAGIHQHIRVLAVAFAGEVIDTKITRDKTQLFRIFFSYTKPICVLGFCCSW